MESNICNICGANYEYKNGRWVCPACGAHKPEELSNEEVTLLYNAATQLRIANFDDAEDLYRDMVQKYPQNAEAHWGLVLAKYGIKYEDDYDGKKLPTCYATSIESVLTDSDYLAAIDLCSDSSRREYYIEQGKAIEKIRIEWIEKASKEPKYDVFLCFKDSDKINKFDRTDDSVEVANLYTHLTELGYRVFYSRVSLREKSGEKYEPYIYNALNTASVMVVYGSKAEYFSSTWMKNEWTRFYKRLRDGLKVEGSLIPACDGVDPADLPKPLGNLQCIDAKAKTFYGVLEKHIEKVLSVANKPKATVDRIEISSAIGKKKTSIGNEIKTIKIGGNVEKKNTVVLETNITTREIGTYEIPAISADEKTKIKNIYRSIENGFWDNAQELVKEVLLKNKFNGQALLASLLISYKSKNIEELSNNITVINDFDLIHSVIDYNEKDIGEKIVGIVCTLVRLFIAKSDYRNAIDSFREISIYNIDIVKKIKEDVLEIAKKLLDDNSSVADDLYEIILDSYQDENTYIDFIQDFVEACLLNGEYEIAKKYNDRIVSIDDGNLLATFSELFIEVKAKNINDFARLSEAFSNYEYLDAAIRKFDKDEIKKCFQDLEQIFNCSIQYQLSGDTICNWFEFITKYEYEGRNEFIQSAINQISSIKNVVTRSSLFDRVIKCIDGSDVEKHISMRTEFAKKLQLSGDFSLAIKYYKQILEIEEGNLVALWNIILCLTESKRDNDISEKIDRFTSFGEVENVLRYCPTIKDRIEYLNKILNAVIFKSGTITNKDYIIKLSKVFDGTVKYYPEEENEQLIHFLQKFADNCKNNSVFELAEKYYAMILTLDKMQHFAYWGVLQSKLQCRNNDDLIKCPKQIANISEFKSAVAAAGDDDRSAEKYWTVARQQSEYQEELKKKEAIKKKKKKKIKILSSVAAALVAVCLVAVWTLIYFKIETNLKYDDNNGYYSVTTGQYYKESNVIIPETYNGKNVTKIADNAFANNTYITSITLPSTITEIGSNAFNGCSNLREVNFLDKTNTNSQANNSALNSAELSTKLLTSNAIVNSKSKIKIVGDNAFNGCILLKEIDLSNVEKIGREAFANCESLDTVNIGENLTVLSEKTFAGCSSLTNIELSEGIIQIGNNCFENCRSITTISIPSTVESVGNSVFAGCEQLSKLVIEERDEGLDGFNTNWKDGLPSQVVITVGFNVTLNYNNATSDGITTVSVIQGEKFELPVPQRNGYKFLGWYDGLINGNRITDELGKSISTYENNESITAVALYEANVNKVVFDANGGNGKMPEQEIATDTTATLLPCDFTKEGYHFIGWGTTTNAAAFDDQANYTIGTDTEYRLFAIWETNVNKLKFDGNGATSGVTVEMSIDSNATVELIANGFAKTGYDFVGWAETANGSKVYNNKDNYTMGLNSEYTLFALWMPKTYSITYKMNDGNTVEQNETSYNIESDPITLINPTKRGYEFIGWSGTGIDDKSKTVTIQTGTYGELSFSANWKAIEYSIKYNLDGGINNIDNPNKYTIENVIQLLDPTKTGYSFISWSPESTIIKGTIGEKEFTANWEIIDYEIRYNLNNSTNNVNNPNTYTVEDTIQLSEPTKLGYVFKGWSEDGIITKGSTGVKTFTANWEIIEYGIEYNLNNGVNNINNPMKYTVEQRIELSAPQKAGYRFVGWTDNGIILKGSTGEKEFTANWEIIEYEIKYNLNNGVNNINNPTKYTVEQRIELLEPARAGYHFDSWSDNGIITKGSTGKKTFTATWEANDNTLSFDANGGNGEITNVTIKTDAKAILPENTLERTGYTFAGWATTKNGSVEYNDKAIYTMGINSSYTLYAVWNAIEYSITYNYNNGIDPHNITNYTIESANYTLINPTRDGYTFTGWVGTSLTENTLIVTIAQGSYGNRNYIANWQANKNKIIFDANGGDGSMSEQEIYTDATVKLNKNTFTASGCNFLGWATSIDGSVVYHDESSYTMGVASSYTLYAVWDVIAYSISYSLNGGSVTGNLSKYTALTPTFTLINPTRDGFTFTGWMGTDLIEKTLEVTVTKGSLGDRVYQANWKANTNTITFNANGGSGEMNQQEIDTDSSEFLSANAFTKAGYTFIGWAVTANGAVVYNDKASYTMGTANNYNLYAKWTPNNNTLILNGNTSTSGSMNNLTIATDASSTLPANTYAKKGYTFIGWATTENGSVEYNDKATYTMGVNSSYTLYAVWQANEYTVTFDAQGGNCSALSKSVTFDQNYTLPVPTRENFNFGGWYTQIGGNGTKLTNNEGVSIENWTIDSAVTVYTLWLGTEELSYSLKDDNTYTVSGITDSTIQNITIPEYYNGKRVTEINSKAFDGSSVTVINATSFLTKINNAAFYGCSELQTLNIPFVGESRTATGEKGILGYMFGEEEFSGSIDTYQYYSDADVYFAYMPQTLTTVNVFDDETISYGAFSAIYSLTNVSIVATSIQTRAFYLCENIESLTLNNGLISIGSNVFTRCTGLTSIIIPDSVTSIGANIFEDCANLETITVPFVGSSRTATGEEGTFGFFFGPYSFDNMVAKNTYNNGVSKYLPASLTTIRITDANQIGLSAFENFSMVKQIIIDSGKGVTEIGTRAFYGCSALKNMNIPDGVTTVDAYAFYNASGMETISIPNGVTTIGNYALYNTKFEKLTLPSSTTTLGDYAIYNDNLKAMFIESSSVVGIQTNTLSKYHSSLKIYAPDNLVSNYQSSWSKVSSMIYAKSCVKSSGMVINGNTLLQYIGDDTKVSIPATITSISSFAFILGKAEYVFIPSTIKTIGADAFNGATYLQSVKISNGVQTISDRAFANTSLTDVVIPNSVTSIGAGAFLNCPLESISLPFVGASRSATVYNGVFGYIFGYETRKNEAYYGHSVSYSNSSSTEFKDEQTGEVNQGIWQYSCYNYYGHYYYFDNRNYTNGYILQSYFYYIPATLKTVTITDATVIQEEAFMNCTMIETVTINEGITSIGNNAFKNCTALEELVIPQSVETIGNAAFRNCDSLTEIEIPENITSINEYCFYDCDNLETITFNNNITTIGKSAFEGCELLQNVDLPDELVTIGENAFCGDTALTTVIIPNKVTSVGKNAFKNCSNVTIVTIGTSVNTISDYAFQGLNKLSSIIIPNNVTIIGIGAFQGCNALTSISLPFVGRSRTAAAYNGVLGYIFGYKTLQKTGGSSSVDHLNSSNTDFVDTQHSSVSEATWQYSCYDYYGYYYYYSSSSNSSGYILQSYFYYIPTTLKTVTITDATRIPEETFYNCAMIETVTINEGITSIGNNAFKNCTALKELIIPQSVETIGNAAFRNCDSLTEIEIPENITSINEYCFYDCDHLSSVTFNDNITTIGRSAFEGCELLQNFGLPDELVTIGENAFCGDTALTTIIIPNKVETIGNNAFKNCSEVTTVTFGTSVKTISDYAFQGLNKVETLSIPNNVSTIGTGAFLGCNNLTSISLPFVGKSRTAVAYNGVLGHIFGNVQTTSTNQSISNSSTNFVDTNAGTTPDGTIWQYTCNNYDRGTSNVSSSVRYGLRSYYYYIPSTLKTVTITDATVIQEEAFYNCAMIETLTINEGITSIGNNTFKNCTALEELIIPQSVETIGNAAFRNCDSLTEIEIPENITSINEYCFYDCDNLETITFNNNITTIGKSAFEGCELLQDVDLPNELVTVGINAFYGDTSITEIIIPSKTKTIGDYAFKNIQITTIVVPNSVTNIGNGAFQGCPLESISLPFIGASRTATIYNGVFGYIFGYTTASTTNTTYGYSSSSSTVFIDKKCSDINGTIWQYSCLTYSYNKYYYNTSYFYHIPTSLISIAITDATAIPEEAFYNCSMIETITINEGITNIGNNAFRNCTALEELILPQSVETIGTKAWQNCSSIKNIQLSNISTISESMLSGCSKLSEINIPLTVTEIGNYALYGCSLITEISIPNSVISIGNYAFSNCYGISTIELPESVTNIGEGLFDGCTNLSEIQLSSKITSIKGYTFRGTKIKSFTVPNNVSSIASFAFTECNSLQYVEIHKDVISIGDYAFLSCQDLRVVRIYNGNVSSLTTLGATNAFNSSTSKNLAIIVPADSLQAYKTATNWSNYSSYIYSDAQVASNKALIVNNVLKQYWGDDTSYIVPDSVTSIGAYAFSDSEIIDITYGSSLTSIGNYAFAGCVNLSKINSLEEGVFNINGNITSIGTKAFAGATKATKIIVNNSVTSIGQGAFNGCNNLVTIELPFIGADCGTGYSYTQVFGYIFDYATKTQTDTIMQYTGYYYYIPSTIREVIITDETAISKNAFINCSMIETITIKSDLSSIGDYAFYECRDLASLVIESTTKPTITEYVFNSNATVEVSVQGAILSDYQTDVNWSKVTLKAI